MGLATSKDQNPKVLKGFTAEVGCFGMSRPPAYSFCGYLRSTSICCGHEIL